MASASQIICPNCDAPGGGDFCAACGQARPSSRDYAIGELLQAGFEELTSYDGRIWRTLKALLFEPGELSRAHFDGQRARYLTPFRIFVTFNVLVWLVVPRIQLTGFRLDIARRVALFPEFWERALALRAEFAGVSAAGFAQRIESLGSAEDAAAVLVLIPLLAIGLSVVLAGRGFRFVHHLVFASHTYCIHLLFFVFLVGAVMMNLLRLFKGHPDWSLSAPALAVLRSFWVQHLLVGLPVFAFLHRALQRAYRLEKNAALWRAALIALWSCVCARGFFDITFALVLTFA